MKKAASICLTCCVLLVALPALLSFQAATGQERGQTVRVRIGQANNRKLSSIRPAMFG